MTENIKYLSFYALLLVILIIGLLQIAWLVLFPAAIVLSVAYIAIKGKSWKQVMGNAEMNGVVVVIAILVSQLLTAGIFYGIGRAINWLFS